MINKYNNDELEKMILVENLSYSNIGKMYGVTGNAIKKIAKNFGIFLLLGRKINPNEQFKHTGKRKIKSKIELKTMKNFPQSYENALLGEICQRNLVIQIECQAMLRKQLKNDARS